jgi:DNA-binding response OmpR family regulator
MIEDDPAVRTLIQEELVFEGFEPVIAETGARGLELLAGQTPDCVLLDLMLPDLSGNEVCRRIRETDPALPLIVISARSAEADKVRSLDLGADDYLTKPFGLAELVARIRAVLRRREPGGAGGGGEVLTCGPLRLDPRRREVVYGARPVELTLKEFEILRLLLERPGLALSRDEILDRVWPEIYVTPRTIDSHVAGLRRKLDGAPFIVGVRGVGYKLDEEMNLSSPTTRGSRQKS